MFDEVSCVIPGASRPEQLESNLRAAALSPLEVGQMAAVRDVYQRRIQPLVHQRW